MAEIYALCCPDTGEVRYIGKADNSKRRMASHLRDARRRKTPIYNWINKLTSEGKKPVMKVIEVADDWESAERRLIAVSRERGDRLLNLADGGGQPGATPESRSTAARSGADQRAHNPFKYTQHKLAQHLGWIIKANDVEGRNDQASKVRALVLMVQRMDAETLFWRVFERPSLRHMLPMYARADAAEMFP